MPRTAQSWVNELVDLPCRVFVAGVDTRLTCLTSFAPTVEKCSVNRPVVFKVALIDIQEYELFATDLFVTKWL